MTGTTTLSDFTGTNSYVSPPFSGRSPDARYAAQDVRRVRWADTVTGKEIWARDVSTDMLVDAGATPSNDVCLVSYVKIRKHRPTGGWVTKITEEGLESYTTRSGETYLKTKGGQRNNVFETRGEAVAYAESEVDGFSAADVKLTSER